MKTRAIIIASLLLCLTSTACPKSKRISELAANPYCNLTDKELSAIQANADFDMPQLRVPNFEDNTINITDKGAIPDGQTLCTNSIQSAIDQISKMGGGTVVIPAGIWLSGPIVLKDNVRLHLKTGALLQFSTDFTLYPLTNTSFEGVETKRCQSPISAYGAQNIAITGHGIINGGGDAWRPLKKNKVAPSVWKEKIKTGVLNEQKNIWYPDSASLQAVKYCVDQNVPENVPDWDAIHSFLRPVMVHLVKCKGVLLEGVTFENSPAWNLHPLMCEDVILYQLNVKNPWYSQNGDGVDVESCKNVIISQCQFDVGDDAICMKSGKNEDGRRRAIPTENVVVTDCEVFHGHGGFVVGSEMSGDVRNITVANCLFIGTDVGLRFKSTRGRGGIVENIYIRNINMTNIPTYPLTFDLFYGGKGVGEETEEEIAKRVNAAIPPVDEKTPQFRNIYIDNVMCNNSLQAMHFNGLPEMKVENVSISNTHIVSQKGAYFNQTNRLTMSNVTIKNASGAPLLMTNVENVKLTNVRDAKGNLLTK